MGILVLTLLTFKKVKLICGHPVRVGKALAKVLSTSSTLQPYLPYIFKFVYYHLTERE